MITTLKKIYFRKRKKEPDMKEIEELLKHHDVEIVNATFDYMEKLLKYFEKQYIWRIFVFDKDDIHDNPFIPYFPSDYYYICLLYTSPSPRDRQKSRMPSSA